MLAAACMAASNEIATNVQQDGALRNSAIHRAIFRRDALLVRRSAARHCGNERNRLWVERMRETAKLAGKSRCVKLWRVSFANEVSSGLS